MNWIEIIDLRSAGSGLEALKQTLAKPDMKKDQKPGLKRIIVYHNASVETDVSIHLRWESKERVATKSDLGVILASALEQIGRVHHSIWLEDEGDEK